MTISVRAARYEDLPMLVRLRLTNAERHIQLDPAVYRIPDVETVRRHFEGVLAQGEVSGVLVLVAELLSEVVGMVEVVVMPDPPDHQILVPRRCAQIHTVVLDGYRGKGVGAALLVAAEQAASDRGISHLYAGIFAPNTGAVRFYLAARFGESGISLRKGLRGVGSGD
jgi:GNAT superfamily N-acetyltransferase